MVYSWTYVEFKADFELNRSREVFKARIHGKNDFQDSSSVFFTFLALFHALFRPYFRQFFSHDFSPHTKFSDIMNSSMI